MPAMLDDPTRPVIYRTSGPPPYPTPEDPSLPPDILPRQVTLRDRVTVATLLPFSSPDQVPASLLNYLCDQFGREIEKGDTYPMLDPLPLSSFGPYWFANFGAVMLLGDIDSAEDIREALWADGIDWEKRCLGSFYIKPNYPGRSSHVCNGGFLVTDAARNKGVGRLMGEGYLEWAPKLGYSYSVFNLVYENNVASCRIWDALGFKRIGRVKGCGNLRSHPGELIDALIYGRDLGPEGEDYISDDRFEKIRFYLKHGKYPNGADRAEKSRLRSAATHYKLVPGENGTEFGEKLMLKDKEVVSDPKRQYEIARTIHLQHHSGINKTTAAIAEKYHWIRIKETVSLVLRNCVDCKEMAPPVRADGMPSKRPNMPSAEQGGVSAAGHVLGLPSSKRQPSKSPTPNHGLPSSSSSPRSPSPPLPTQQQSSSHNQSSSNQQCQAAPINHMQNVNEYSDMPLDPQIMEDVRQHLPEYNHSPYATIAPSADPSSRNQQNHNPFTLQQGQLNATNVHQMPFQQGPLLSTNDGYHGSHVQGHQLNDYQAFLNDTTTNHHLHHSSGPNLSFESHQQHHPPHTLSLTHVANGTSPNTNECLAQGATEPVSQQAQQAMGHMTSHEAAQEEKRVRELNSQLLRSGHYGVGGNNNSRVDGRGRF